MAAVSVLPPLASIPPPLPPPTEDAAADAIRLTSSPCGSVRIHRPQNGDASQENIGVPVQLKIAEQLNECSAEAATTSEKGVASTSLATIAAEALERLPLEPVSSATHTTADHGVDTSILRYAHQTDDDLLFCRQTAELYTTKPIPGMRVHEPRETSLDDYTEKVLVGDALRESIDNFKAFIAAPEAQPARQRRPFRKWVQTFNRRRAERRIFNQLEICDTEPITELQTPRTIGDSSYRRHSSSVSSFAYVAGIRDASISGFATASIVPSSRKQAARSSKVLSRTDRSSRFSMSARQSDDDTANDRQRQLAEGHIVARSIQRRRILEELIETEEGYIGDIKFLMNAYMTIFASSPSADAGLRLAMYSNLTDIVELHDQILGELHRAIPDSEYSHLSIPRHRFGAPVIPMRNSMSFSSVPEDQGKRQSTLCKEAMEMTIAPDIAAKAANVFVRKIDRFYIYEEYRAKLDMVLDDLKMTYRSIPNWDNHQKGLEALASCLSYSRDWKDSKRALTIDDLLAKPIQRACRYPLLFHELLKSTPVCDCPRAHSDIETALEKLHAVTVAMNKATEDPFFKSHLEKTWLLQERLTFPAHARNGATKGQIRLFGRIDLCGVLHVCWQTQSSVRGSYMICLLYHSWLCLAAVDKTGKLYELQACIPLKKCSLEQADNGKGLQCHSAPFSWKVAFEVSGQLYEVLMTASAKKEEAEWWHRIKDGGMREDDCDDDRPMFTFLALDIKTLGAARKSTDRTGRKHSIRRATTVSPKVQLFQGILENTSSEKGDSQSLEKKFSLGRSHSVRKASRIPMIAPPRGDRARLESAISDVCTRDVLMSSAFFPRVRGDRIRPSASAMMRKINVPSLSSTFGRRTISRTEAVLPYLAVDAALNCESTPQAPTSPRHHFGDHKIRLSLGHARLRHHERDDKASQDIREEADKAEKTIKMDKGRPGSSSDDDAGKAYSLAGHALSRPAELRRPKYSLFRKESSDMRATEARNPPARFTEFGERCTDTSSTPKTISSMPPIPSLPSMPLMQSATSSSFLRAVIARPRSSGETSSKSLTSVTGELLTSSTTYKMMAPLSRHGYQGGRASCESRGSRGSQGLLEDREDREGREEQEGMESKSSRRWLKRPSLHRPSLHRTLKRIH